MQLYYLRLRKTHLPQGKHNALQKGAHVHRGARRTSALTGVRLYKPVQLAWLTPLFGGYELALVLALLGGMDLRGLHSFLHVALVFLVDVPRRSGQ
jgi:thiosulfate reductase cytochrome b subunit